MDPVTHLLAGYLLGTVAFASGPMVAWTTFMAFFPDFDTVSWVFRKRLKWLRHRGVTHSLVVGAAASAIGAGYMAYRHAVPWPLAFAAGMIGFLSHVILDYLNWGCLILWPWRKHGVEFTVQMALTGPLVASTIGFAALATGRALAAEAFAMALVGGLWIAYLVAKVLLKMRLRTTHGRTAAVYPTRNPLRWRIVVTGEKDGHRETRYLYSTFRGRFVDRVLFTSRHRVTPPPLPLETPDDAAAFAFLTPEVQGLASQYLALAHDVSGGVADGWIVRWYALDYHTRRGCYGARVRVNSDGTYEAEKGLLPFRPSRPRGAAD